MICGFKHDLLLEAELKAIKRKSFFQAFSFSLKADYLFLELILPLILKEAMDLALDKIEDPILDQIFKEFMYSIIIMVAEKLNPNFRIQDIQKFGDILDKYTKIFKPACAYLFFKWKEGDYIKLRNKISSSTIEDLYVYTEDQDYKDVFRMLRYLINKKILCDILKDLGEKCDQCDSLVINIEKHTLEVTPK